MNLSVPARGTASRAARAAPPRRRGGSAHAQLNRILNTLYRFIHSIHERGRSSKLVLLGSKLITYKKEKTGRVACNQPGGTSLLGRLLRVDDRGMCASKCSDGDHSTGLGGTSIDNRHVGRSKWGSIVHRYMTHNPALVLYRVRYCTHTCIRQRLLLL